MEQFLDLSLYLLLLTGSSPFVSMCCSGDVIVFNRCVSVLWSFDRAAGRF